VIKQPKSKAELLGSFRECNLAEIVLCSALVYTALAGLHRTNSLATRLQQPVPYCNKPTQLLRQSMAMI